MLGSGTRRRAYDTRMAARTPSDKRPTWSESRASTPSAATPDPPAPTEDGAVRRDGFTGALHFVNRWSRLLVAGNHCRTSGAPRVATTVPAGLGYRKGRVRPGRGARRRGAASALASTGNVVASLAPFRCNTGSRDGYVAKRRNSCVTIRLRTVARQARTKFGQKGGAPALERSIGSRTKQLPDLRLHHLAKRVARERLHHGEGARHLVGRESLFGPRAEVG